MKNECTLINESWVLAGEMHKIERMVLLAACLLVLGSTQPLLADITNRDFSDGLSGWSWTPIDGTDETGEPLVFVFENDGRAVLTLDYMEDLPCSTLSQNGIYLDLDSDKWLFFDLVMEKSGESGPAGNETDEFTATFGPSGSSSAFYTLLSSDFEDTSYSKTVPLPLTGWASGPYELLFKLTNVHPDATATSVFIDNVRLVPVPGAVVLGSLGLSFSGWLLRRRTASY